MILKNGAGPAPAATDCEARKIVGIGKCDGRTSKPSSPPTQDRIIAELIGSDTCRADSGITVRSTAPVLALCRELLAAGLDPDAAVEAYRAGTLALRVRTIGEGARLELNAKGTGFVVQAVRRASPVRQNDEAGTGYLADVPPLLARGGK
jgi:hypothetical protein